MEEIQQSISFSEREFPMTEENFQQIKDIAYETTGIKLSDHKKEMIYSRIARRIRSLGLSNFDQYCDLISSDSNREQSDFINAITTNLTSFFREEHHFDFMRETVIPDLKSRHQKDRRIRIWSAGCSTGEEPYSLAITLHGEFPRTGWDLKILATDLDSNVLAHASSGRYRRSNVEEVKNPAIKDGFLKASDKEDTLKVRDEIKKLISFKRLNLLEQWPMKGQFDVIFCRNVVIYFDKATQRALFERYANILTPNGYLFIGHSESLHRVSERFRLLGKTIYQKID